MNEADSVIGWWLFGIVAAAWFGWKLKEWAEPDPFECIKIGYNPDWNGQEKFVAGCMAGLAERWKFHELKQDAISTILMTHKDAFIERGMLVSDLDVLRIMQQAFRIKETYPLYILDQAIKKFCDSNYSSIFHKRNGHYLDINVQHKAYWQDQVIVKALKMGTELPSTIGREKAHLIHHIVICAHAKFISKQIETETSEVTHLILRHLQTAQLISTEDRTSYLAAIESWACYSTKPIE